jgi:hypothetical protein
MANMPAGPVSRPWRRYLRFSVRGLIVLVLVLGAGLGWLVRGARIQREAVAAITIPGGAVRYDWEGTIEGFVPEGKLWAPRWLVDLIGVDYFGHVISASLFRSSTARRRRRVLDASGWWSITGPPASPPGCFLHCHRKPA